MQTRTWIKVGLLTVLSVAVLAALAVVAAVLIIIAVIKPSMERSDDMKKSIEHVIRSCGTDKSDLTCAHAFGREEFAAPRPEFPPGFRELNVPYWHSRKRTTRGQGTAFFGASAPVCFSATFFELDAGWAIDDVRTWAPNDNGCEDGGASG